MMRTFRQTLQFIPLTAALLFCAAPGFAEDISPDSIPSVGSIAPAFGLYAFPTSGSLKKSSSDEREVVQLDDLCGLRPAKTKAVVLLFVEGNEEILAAEPVGNWYRKYHRDGLELVVISVEKNPSIFASRVMRTKPRYPVLDDRHRVVARRYGVNDAPFTFLLNAECRVLGFDQKSATEAVGELTAAIEELVRDRVIPDDEGEQK